MLILLLALIMQGDWDCVFIHNEGVSQWSEWECVVNTLSFQRDKQLRLILSFPSEPLKLKPQFEPPYFFVFWEWIHSQQTENIQGLPLLEIEESVAEVND